jgi:hypothetical protein
MRIRHLAVPALIPTAFLLGTFVNTGFTQQAAATPAIVEVGCMKVDPAREDEYLKLEHDLWRPVHQERIRQGRMRSWTLYAVRFPSGSKNECDYRTVNVYNSLVDVDRPLPEVFAKVHPNLPISDVVRRTIAGRDFRTGEIWYQVDQAQ